MILKLNGQRVTNTRIRTVSESLPPPPIAAPVSDWVSEWPPYAVSEWSVTITRNRSFLSVKSAVFEGTCPQGW